MNILDPSKLSPLSSFVLRYKQVQVEILQWKLSMGDCSCFFTPHKVPSSWKMGGNNTTLVILLPHVVINNL